MFRSGMGAQMLGEFAFSQSPLASPADANGVHEREQIVESAVSTRGARHTGIKRLNCSPLNAALGIRPNGRNLF